jgi:hypothetical protein
MATYYLEVDDELTAAAARIRACPDEAVALVLPGGSRVATSRINFRVLAREATQRKRRLTIVAPEAEVRSLARSAGLPVYSTVAEYEAAEAGRLQVAPNVEPDAVSAALGQLAATIDESPRGGPPGRAGGSVGHAGAREDEQEGGSIVARLRRVFSGPASIGLVVAVVGIAAIGAYLFLPATTITLTVREDPVGPTAMTVTIDPSLTKADDAVLATPGETRQFDLSQRGTYSATGQQVIDTAAGGAATFSSLNTVSDVVVEAGTQVWTDAGTVFTTSQQVKVPKATVSGDTITRGTATVPILARVAGVSGNVAAGTIVNVPAGLLAQQISVANQEATSGGSHTVLQVVRQSDVDKAKASLTAALTLELAADLKDVSLVPPGQLVFAETARLNLDTLAYAPDPASLVDQQAASFDLAATASGTATAVEVTALESLAEHKLQAGLSQGYRVVQGSLSLQYGQASADGVVATLPLTATAMAAPSLDPAQLRAAVEGKSLDAARRYLSQYGKVEISSWPGLWSSDVAAYDFRIDIRVVFPTPSLSPTPMVSPSAAGSTGKSPGGSS